MNNENSIMINVNELNKLIIDINEYAIKIRKIFDRIESIVESTKSYFACDCATIYRRKFDDFKSDFPIIVNNILTYKTDMQNLKSMFAKGESDLSKIVLDEKKMLSSNEKIRG